MWLSQTKMNVHFTNEKERTEKKNQMVNYYNSCLQNSKIQTTIQKQTLNKTTTTSPLVRRLGLENKRLMHSESIIVEQQEQQQIINTMMRLSSTTMLKSNNKQCHDRNEQQQQKKKTSYSKHLMQKEVSKIQKEETSSRHRKDVLSQSLFAHRPCDYSYHCKLPIRCVFDLQHGQYHRLFVVLIEMVQISFRLFTI